MVRFAKPQGIALRHSRMRIGLAAAIGISQQYRGARPPSREENYRSHDGLQVVLECPETERRNRYHAHGEEGAVALPRQQTHVHSRPVLQLGFLNFEEHVAFSQSANAIATEP